MPLVSNLCSWRESIMSNSHIVWTKPYSTLWCLSYRKLLHGPANSWGCTLLRGLPDLPLSEPHFPKFPSKSCTNLLHLPVLMLMPRHHLRALQKWQNTMTSAQSPCEAGLGRVAICKENNKSRCPNDCTGLGTHQHFTITQSCKHLQTMGQHLSIHTNFNNINYKISTSSFAHLITHPSHISVPSPEKPWGPQTVNPIENARSARLRRLPWIISQGHGLCK